MGIDDANHSNRVIGGRCRNVIGLPHQEDCLRQRNLGRRKIQSYVYLSMVKVEWKKKNYRV